MGAVRGVKVSSGSPCRSDKSVSKSSWTCDGSNDGPLSRKCCSESDVWKHFGLFGLFGYASAQRRIPRVSEIFRYHFVPSTTNIS